MKARFVIAIIVVCLLVGFAVGEEVYVTRVFRQYEARLDAIDTTSPLKEEDILALKDWWHTKHKKLEIILPHNNINEITYVYGEMLGAIKAMDDKSAQAQFTRLKATVGAISEMYGWRVGNIF